MHVHSIDRIINKRQSVEAIQVSIDWWLDDLNMVYTYIEILFSLKKEDNSDTWLNMEKPWVNYAKWNVSHKRKDIVWSHLFEVSRVDRFLKTENKRMITKG